MTKLEVNLYSIAFLATNLKLSVYSISEASKNEKLLSLINFPEDFLQKIGFKNSIIAIVSEYSIIQFCSFLDEYKKFSPKFIESEYSERIIKVREKNKYGIKRIEQWKNLYDYRNHIAAHNFNIKNKPILTKVELTEYNIPDTLQKKILFYKIVEKICRNIFEEFSEIRNNFNFSITVGQKLSFVKTPNFDLKNGLKLIEENM